MTARRVRIDGATHDIALAVDAGTGAFTVREGERTIAGTRRWAGARLEIEIGGRAREAHVVRGPRGGIELWISGERYAVEELRGGDAAGGANGGSARADDDAMLAPMPAKIVRVHVAAGDAVADGQALVVLESMKMELSVTAPRAGRVRRVGADVIPGAIVAAGTLLVELEPASPAKG
jgi:acetyl/propionyl-CoA carboxylase alpha subunit